MKRLSKLLTQRLRTNKEVISNCKSHLSNAKDDTLVIRNTHNRIQFYKKTSDGQIYIPNSSPLIRKLAQNAYYKKALKIAQKENAWIERTLKELEKETLKDIYHDDPIRRGLITPLIENDDEYMTKWINEPYNRKPISFQNATFPTDKGDYVRSKSEALIANMLYRLKIPYRYECEVELKGYGTVYPDFIILDIAERKEYIWEHLGMLDNPIYVDKALSKLATYAKNNIFPGDRLITTYEDSKHPLNITLIEKQIRTLLNL